MKINSLYIASFGGIKDLSLDFSDGFNVIYAQNESGKTTIMSFIKMMFYGSERGGNSLSKNIRKRYTPWDNSQMAGSINFTHAGKKYRLEKEFRSSNSTDKATLFDLNLSESQTVSGDIGRKIFGLSLASFERSVFIGQFGFPENDAEAEGEIASKLSNLALSGEESVSFEQVNARLQKAKTALISKSGKAGEYSKNSALYQELNEEIRKAEAAKSEYNIKKNDIENLQAEIVLANNTLEQLRAKIAAEEDCRNYKKYQKLLDAKARLDEISQELTLSDGRVLDELYLNKVRFCISKVEKAQSDILSKENEITTLKKSIEAGLNPPENATEENKVCLQSEVELLKLKREDFNNELTLRQQKLLNLNNALPNAKSKKKGFNKPILIVSAIIFALAIVLFFVKWVVGVVALIGAIAVAVLGFCIKPLDTEYLQKLNSDIESERLKISEIEKNLNEITFNIGAKNAELEAINAALNATAKVIENQEELLSECTTDLETLKKQEKSAFSELAELFIKYKKAGSLEEIKESLDEMKQKADSIKAIKTELNIYQNELGGVSYEAAREKLEALKGVSLDSGLDFKYLKEKYDTLLAEIGEKKAEIVKLVTEAKSQMDLIGKLDGYYKKRDALKQRLDEQKEYCDILDIASEVLAESFSEVHSSYGLVLENKAGEIFSRLTDSKYGGMTISKAFDISVRENDAFGSRDIGFLSSGTADQGYLSLRLAIAELICKDTEDLPIFLDDSLAQYDDIRMEKAVEFLSEYSKAHQVIMFTCHNSVAQISKENNATVGDLV